MITEPYCANVLLLALVEGLLDWQSYTRCSDGFHHHGAKCFIFRNEEKTWENARLDCQRRWGADLAEVSDVEEQDFLAKETVKIKPRAAYYVGINSIGKDRYSTCLQNAAGQPRIYGHLKWKSSDPASKDGSFDVDQNCVVMVNGALEQTKCNEAKRYICEKAADMDLKGLGSSTTRLPMDF